MYSDETVAAGLQEFQNKFVQSLEKDIDREVVEIQNNGIMVGEYIYFDHKDELKQLVKKEQVQSEAISKNDIKIFYKQLLVEKKITETNIAE